MNRDEEKTREQLINELNDLRLQVAEAESTIKQLMVLCEAQITEEGKNQQEALSIIKTLKGPISTCAWCRKVRDDKGCWNGLEKYLRENSGVGFTYGICPECLKKTEPEIYNELSDNGRKKVF